MWPKYVALNPRLLDKLELIFADLGSRVRPGLVVDVHSGFRSPSHNSRVESAARDSRHQYGDAADLAVDADGDGRITMTDELLVMLAVERVEEAHPDLVGGLGHVHEPALSARRTCTSTHAGSGRAGRADDAASGLPSGRHGRTYSQWCARRASGAASYMESGR